jgi:hypothetical protein
MRCLPEPQAKILCCFFAGGQPNLAHMHIDYRDGLMKFEYHPKRGYHPTNH